MVLHSAQGEEKACDRYTDAVSSPRAERLPRREIELDFIRGIAILLVLDYHSPGSLLNFVSRRTGMPQLGWVGVDVFFVLSGFLVGGLLVKEWKVRGKIAASSFLLRRGLKIWPQYYVFLALMLATRHRSLRELWGNLLNIQNYVGGVAHTWSLAVEEHAYLLILVIFAIAGHFEMRMRTVFAIFSGLIACAVAAGLYQISNMSVFALTQTRIGGILAGVLLAILYHYRPETFRLLQHRRWIWYAVAAGSLACVYLTRKSWTTVLLIDLADLSAVALLMLLYRHHEGRRRGWVYRTVAKIGLYSYGIYLWHVSVLAPVQWVAQRLPGTAALVWDVAAPVLLGIMVGVGTTHLVEFPMLRLRERWSPRRVDSPVGTPAEEEQPSLPAYD